MIGLNWNLAAGGRVWEGGLKKVFQLMLMMLAGGLPGRTWESELTRFAADADDALRVLR